MDGEHTGEIRFFSYGTRLNRLRYFVYSGAVTLLIAFPAFIIAGILVATGHGFLGGLLILAALVFLETMAFVLAVRRLHDIGRSGWWSLIFAVILPFSILRALGRLSGIWFTLYVLLFILQLATSLILLFWRGDVGDNRYGPQPPPNSDAVYIGLWSCLGCYFILAMLVAMALSRGEDNIARKQARAAVAIAHQGVYPATKYFEQNRSWPVDLASLYGDVQQHDLASINTISYPGGGYGIVVTVNRTGLNYQVANRAVEVWTLDGGQNWHCGPAASEPMPDDLLPEDCREEPPPTH